MPFLERETIWEVFLFGPISLLYQIYEGGCVALFSTHKGKSTPKPPGMNKEKITWCLAGSRSLAHQTSRVGNLLASVLLCVCVTHFQAHQDFWYFFCARWLSFFSIHTWIEPPPGRCTKSVSVPYPCMRWKFIVRKDSSFATCHRFFSSPCAQWILGDAGALSEILFSRGVKNVFDMRALLHARCVCGKVGHLTWHITQGENLA